MVFSLKNYFIVDEVVHYESIHQIWWNDFISCIITNYSLHTNIYGVTTLYLSPLIQGMLFLGALTSI
jgi:hypothetical protein